MKSSGRCSSSSSLVSSSGSSLSTTIMLGLSLCLRLCLLPSTYARRITSIPKFIPWLTMRLSSMFSEMAKLSESLPLKQSREMLFSSAIPLKTITLNFPLMAKSWKGLFWSTNALWLANPSLLLKRLAEIFKTSPKTKILSSMKAPLSFKSTHLYPSNTFSLTDKHMAFPFASIKLTFTPIREVLFESYVFPKNKKMSSKDKRPNSLFLFSSLQLSLMEYWLSFSPKSLPSSKWSSKSFSWSLSQFLPVCLSVWPLASFMPLKNYKISKFFALPKTTLLKEAVLNMSASIKQEL